jgi:hypothetical protein
VLGLTSLFLAGTPYLSAVAQRGPTGQALDHLLLALAGWWLGAASRPALTRVRART